MQQWKREQAQQRRHEELLEALAELMQQAAGRAAGWGQGPVSSGVAGGQGEMSTALSAIGGAIDRATIARCGSGGSCSSSRTLGAGIITFYTLSEWSTMPTLTPGENPFAEELKRRQLDGTQTTERPSRAESHGGAAAADNPKTRLAEQLVGAAALFLAGAIFLGLTRVTRWIVTGK